MAANLQSVASSGIKVADAAIMTVPGRLMGITCYTDGTNASTAVCYDHASAASGTVVGRLACPGADLGRTAWFGPQGIGCAAGIYLDLTQAGTSGVIVYYQKERGT